ncbi:MAG TPA: hypothetical protein VGK33_02195, partial [Chloroflexota bacterium]
MAQNEAHRRQQLRRGVARRAERRGLVGRLALFRVAVRLAEAVEIERPDVEPGLAERIAPRAPAEPERHRQGGRKRRAVHVEHRSRRFALRRPTRGQPPQEEVEVRARAGNVEMLLGWIEGF